MQKGIVYIALFFQVCLIYGSPVVLTDASQTVKPATYGALLADPNGELSLQEVFDKNFSSIAKNNLQFDKIAKVQWMKLSMDNRSVSSLTYFLSTTSSADYCDVYIVQGEQQVLHTRSGSLVPVSERPYREHLLDPYIPVKVPAGESTVYIRIESQRLLAKEHRDVKRLAFIGSEAFERIMERNTYTDGIMLGACIILLLFCLLLYLINRELLYLLTFFMLFMLSLYPFSALGYLLKYFLYDVPYLETYADYLFGCLAATTIFAGAVGYLKLPEFAPKTTKVIYGAVALQLVLFIPSFFSGGAFKLWLMVTALSLFPLIYGIYSSIKARYRLAYYYLAGIICLSGMFFIFLFRWFGWIGYETFMIWFNGQLFTAIFGFFLLLGLTDRFFQVRREALEKQLEGERTIRKAEAEKSRLIAEQKEELEQKVAERTAEIAEKNRQLLKLDELKSRFFANISHEFRTPITLIVGPVENYLNEGKTNLSREELESILKNANQLLRLINQLLDLAKAETGKLDLYKEQVNVREFIDNEISSFLPFAETKSIALKVIHENDALTAIFDKEKIRQSFNNVLNNALKYSKKGSEITINTSINNNRLRLVISDQGSGIPDDQKTKVFERFYQYDGQKIAEGTGIGLALSKEFVELHEGTIYVEDNEPTGARFVISLPIQNISVEETTATLALQNTPDEEQEGIPSVLVVEDHTEVRSYIKSCLKDNYALYEAENGRSGIAIAKKVLPNLIISDIMMPITDGLELVKVLKEDLMTSHIPIILLTAKGALKNKLEGLQSSADDYLVKPFNKEELLARVQNLIDNRMRLREAFGKNVLAPTDTLQIPGQDKRFLDMTETMILEHLEDESYNIESLSNDMRINRTTLFRKLKALTGQSPSLYIRTIRLKKAIALMKKNNMSVSEVAYAVGFGSPAYFTKCFKEQFGVTPKEF